MKELDAVLRSMTLEFFGSGEHKIEVSELLGMSDAVLLDVRSVQEQESLRLELKHHLTVLEIPVDEVPDRRTR